MTQTRYFKIEIDARGLDRLKAVHAQIDRILDRGPISSANLIHLLLDHWQFGHPPQPKWVRGQANLYPANMGSKARKWLR